MLDDYRDLEIYCKDCDLKNKREGTNYPDYHVPGHCEWKSRMIDRDSLDKILRDTYKRINLKSTRRPKKA